MTHVARRRRQGGFTLSEIAVASAIFLFVMVAAFAAFTGGNKAYKNGQTAAEMQQRTRLAFDQMLDEVRLAGFDYDRDGSNNTYPEQSDEQLEYLGPHALVFRGNLNFGNSTGGRETSYESTPGSPNYTTTCCPIVTTSNAEIVGYALRSADSTKNTGHVRFNADTSRPRDGIINGGGLPIHEEAVSFDNVDLTGNNPPYTLMRFSLDDSGNVIERPIADNVRALNFTYTGTDGNTYYCTSVAADGSCASGNQVPFTTILGGDDISSGDGKGRKGRAAVRSFSVELNGMADKDDMSYVDATDTSYPHRRKLDLVSNVVPPNLGVQGKPDLTDDDVQSPANVSVCAGQCNTIRVEWDGVTGAAQYRVNLYLTNAATPFFQGITPGVQVAGSTRVFAIYQRPDDSHLITGTQVFSKVEARTQDGKYSPKSDPSLVVTLTNVTKDESPTDMKATGYDPAASGWPDVSSTLPDTTNASLGYGTQPNQITISWMPPAWALNVSNPAQAATTWTVQTGSGTYPPLDCDKLPISQSPSAALRTPSRDLIGSIRYYVFRSTSPRFIPTSSNLIAQTAGTVDPTTGRMSYTDQTAHVFSGGVFNSTLNALENCKTYYYRVRAVSDCYSGGTAQCASTTNLNLSPFYPKLNTNSSAANSDDTSSLSPSQVGLAIPGYAIPQAQPAAPTGVRFHDFDTSLVDGDGYDVLIAFDAVKKDTFTVNGVSQPDDITVSEYRVYSHPGNANFTVDNIDNPSGSVRLDKIIYISDLKAGRIDHDDENGDGVITAAEDESVPPSSGTASPASGLRIDLPDTSTRWYRVAAIWCENENTVPSTSDHTSLDLGQLSSAKRFPCYFGNGPYSSVVSNAAGWPNTVTGTAFPQDPTVPATYGRLILEDPSTGDRTESPSPGNVASANLVTFNASDISSLTDNFGNGNYRIFVEMSDGNGCTLVSGDAPSGPPLPACCMTATLPNINRSNSSTFTNSVRESCGVADLRITQIVITVDNANGKGVDKFNTVLWGTTTLWTGTNDTVTIDRTSNPLVLAIGTSQVLTMRTGKDIAGDNASVTYTYKVGGQTGTCTFSQRPI